MSDSFEITIIGHCAKCDREIEVSIMDKYFERGELVIDIDAEFCDSCSADSYEEGKEEGYDEGFEAGKEEAEDEKYNDGYREGFRDAGQQR